LLEDSFIEEKVTNAYAHEMVFEMKCKSWRISLSLDPWKRIIAWMRDKCHGTHWQAKVAPPLWWMECLSLYFLLGFD